MKTSIILRILLLASLIVSISASAFAKKGGNGKPGGGGGGDDGGGTPAVLTGQPALLYSTGGDNIVFSNGDGTAKKIMVSGGGAREAEFVPNEDAVVYYAWEEGVSGAFLRRLNYELNASGEPVVQSTKNLDIINLEDADIIDISVTPSGQWVAYEVWGLDPSLVHVVRF